jgi:hypothetical protein
MIRLLAVLFGIVFIAVGVSGFIPSVAPNGFLFGIFEVNFVHNLVHLASGVLAIMAATRLSYTKLYFLIFGIAYTVGAIVGFARQGDLWIMHVNLADNFLHLAIGVVAIYLGYYAHKKEIAVRS